MGTGTSVVVGHGEASSRRTFGMCACEAQMFRGERRIQSVKGKALKSHSGVTNVPMGTTRQRGKAMRPVVKRILYLGKLTSGTKRSLRTEKENKVI